MSNQIVVVNVSQTVAPAPSTLQATGALISQGATTTSAQTETLITQMSDLTAILKGALALTSLVWSGGTVTATTAVPHGFTVSDTLPLTIAGETPSGYNGTFTCTITGASTFTYPLASNPGSQTVAGVYTPEDVAELVAMATTFFAQGKGISVYVLELGAGNATDGVTALTTFINGSPQTIYSYLVPRYWDANSAFLAFLATFEATTAKTYFFITTTTGTYTSYTAQMKCAFTMVEAPSIPSTEFSCAAPFAVSLSYAPSTLNMVTPFAFSFLFGVTPYPLKGNNALFTALKAASVNWVATGAEGGISTAILKWGTTQDGRQFTYWYSVDWHAINFQLDIANAIINGSNDPLAPLYYNPPGIDTLQAVAQRTANRGITYGLALGPSIVNAVPFGTYVAENPSDFPYGVYNGLSCVMTPNNPFLQITFYLNVTDFPVA